ncbi:hypothetical protein [Methylomonas koyamae]|uniref:hypothetical protein n=1 Tax=Methylomonas koyamae TaxID=702114 RepID=UPI002872E604|nr:hypothetical protein [Methylomonas koyamae]WNB74215.1 hypothetical protein RI210_13115 [Methylomonas koyamae]
MKAVVKKILNQPSFVGNPPVLVDLGASGDFPKPWNLIAPYSICVGFDADTREFSVSETENKEWKKLYLINRLVADRESEEVDFYFTKSPYCSSSLRPNNMALQSWAFSSLFEIEKVDKLSSVLLLESLRKVGIDYIDWYKSDTQGADLRIFDSLPKVIKEKILLAEFEPGIIDAYFGEDKLHQLMAYMDVMPFWISGMDIKGSQRIDSLDFRNLGFLARRSIGSFLKSAPGWCEIAYINTMEDEKLSRRDWLLAWLFASIKQEHGFALYLARLGADKFDDDLFNELYAISSRSLSPGYVKYAVRMMCKVAKRFRRSTFRA